MSVPAPASSPAARPLLRVSGLSKRFGALQALTDVSLEVPQGASAGLIGPNGSGKTTFFNCVTGVHPPSAGSVSWEGADITGRRPEAVARRGLIRTFQSVLTFAEEPVAWNVRTVAEAAARNGREGTPGVPADVDSILELCGLGAAAGRPAGDLSYGQGRTLGIAVALAARPRLLMLDEPASGLNHDEAQQLAGLLRLLNESGLTLLVIDHDMAFLLPIVSQVTVLDAGRRIAEGDAGQVRNDPGVMAAYLGRGFERRRSRSEASGIGAAVPAPAPGHSLEVRGLKAGYGRSEVLHGVDLDVGPGEAVAVLGANGAGKTTLMRAISGLIPIAAGSVTYGPISIVAAPARRVSGRLSRILSRGSASVALRLHAQGLVHVPEGRHVFPEMSVRDNLLVATRQLPGRRVPVGDLLASTLDVFPVLKQRLDAAGGSLSGGQQQMLAIGRGLMAQPDLLCLDEPSLGLAPVAMEALADRILAIRRERRLALLVVEQCAPMALEICDRVYVVQNGLVVGHSRSEDMVLEELTSGYLGGRVSA